VGVNIEKIVPLFFLSVLCGVRQTYNEINSPFSVSSVT
jgi:hypothetical protein